MEDQNNNFNQNDMNQNGFNNVGQNNFYQNNVNMMNNINNMNNNPNNMEDYPIDNETLPPEPEKTEKNGVNKIFVFIGLFFLIVIVIFLINKNMKKNNEPAKTTEETVEKENETPEYDENSEAPVKIIMLGEVGSGKTQTVSAITKFHGEFKSVEELDKVTETRENYSYYASKTEVKTDKKEYIIYNPSNNNDIVKMLIGGRPEIDCAIVVFSTANDSFAQVKEQIDLLNKVGIKKVVVFLNEPDGGTQDAFMTKLEIRNILEKYGFSSETPLVEGNVDKVFEDELEANSAIKELMRRCDDWLRPLNRIYSSTKNATVFKAETYFKAKEEDGKNSEITTSYKPNIRFDKGTIASEIAFPEMQESMFPGEHTNLTITLSLKTKIQIGTHFDIIENDKIIGFGIVTEFVK